jgi:dTDP-4-amino-4,6-dideoxygalactose transaminase
MHILSKAVHWKEKRGKKPGYFPKRLPNALAALALNQFEKLEKFNAHRREMARYYALQLQNTSFVLPKDFVGRENIFLRFVIQHPRAHEIIRKAWDRNLLIGDWYTSPIAPDDTKVAAVGYRQGICPVAEKLSRITLNLPTHINISQREADTILSFLRNEN